MKIKEIYIVYLLVAVHGLAAIFTGYFEAGTINPGTIRGGISALFLFYFVTIRYNLKSEINIFILVYLLFFFGLVLSSSSFTQSFYHYVGFAISMMMLPVGLYYLKDSERLYKVSYFFLLVSAALLISIVVANIYSLGDSSYLDDSFYYGAARVNITKTMIVLLFTAPIYLYLEKSRLKRNIAVIIYISTVAVCLIGIKRSVLISLLLGVLIYIVLGPNIVKHLKYYILAAILFLFSYPLYEDVFRDRLEAREAQLQLTQESFETQGRYFELNMVMHAFRDGSLKHKIVGSEMFNDREFYNTHRMLHTDYMILLSGAGIIGLIFWIMLYLLLIFEKKKYSKYLPESDFVRILSAVFWMLIAAQILMSISGTIYGISLRSFLFLFIGGILSNFRTIARYTKSLIDD